MTKTLWNCLLASPAICGAMLIVGVAAGNPVLAETTTAEVLQPLVAESLEKDKITTFSATRLNSLTQTQVANPPQLAGNSLSNGDSTAEIIKPISQSNQKIEAQSVMRGDGVERAGW